MPFRCGHRRGPSAARPGPRRTAKPPARLPRAIRPLPIDSSIVRRSRRYCSSAVDASVESSPTSVFRAEHLQVLMNQADPSRNARGWTVERHSISLRTRRSWWKPARPAPTSSMRRSRLPCISMGRRTTSRSAKRAIRLDGGRERLQVTRWCASTTRTTGWPSSTGSRAFGKAGGGGA